MCLNQLISLGLELDPYGVGLPLCLCAGLVVNSDVLEALILLALGGFKLVAIDKGVVPVVEGVVLRHDLSLLFLQLGDLDFLRVTSCLQLLLHVGLGSFRVYEF